MKSFNQLIKEMPNSLVMFAFYSVARFSAEAKYISLVKAMDGKDNLLYAFKVVANPQFEKNIEMHKQHLEETFKAEVTKLSKHNGLNDSFLKLESIKLQQLEKMKLYENLHHAVHEKLLRMSNHLDTIAKNGVVMESYKYLTSESYTRLLATKNGLFYVLGEEKEMKSLYTPDMKPEIDTCLERESEKDKQ